MPNIDETIIVDRVLPKQWKCPHCGKIHKFYEEDNMLFMGHTKFIRHCEKCGYLHFWKLELTDEFKKRVCHEIERVILYGKAEID